MYRPSGSKLAYDMGEVVRNEVCLGGLCVPEATVQAAAVAAFGVLTLLVLVGLAYVYDAKEALSEERERVEAERNAFRRFATQVRRTEADAGASAARTDAPVTVRTKPPDSGIGTVRDAYRETVMDVRHFDDEYGEELVTNAAAELSPEVAAALAGDGTLNPQLRSALVTQSHEAADSRETLLDAIDDEMADLDATTERLERVETEVDAVDDASFLPYSYHELEETHARLAELREDVSEIVADRQETVHEGWNGAAEADAPDFQGYVYNDLDVRYPLLAAATELLDRVDEVESEVVRSLLRRA